MAYQRRGVKLGLGLTRVSAPRWSSEPGYVQGMNAAIKVLEQELLDILEMFEVETPQVTYEALKPVFARSQELVPRRTGRLAASGYLEITDRGKTPRVEMGYGRGGNPRYAVMVHEIPQKHPPPTQWKFLEQPIMEDLNGIYFRIGKGYASRFWL
jgi:hypothetical protein